VLRALLIVSVVANSAQAATLAEIKAAGVLRVGTTGDYKPFSFRDPDGSFRGADIAMMQDLAAHLGVRLAIVPTAWAKLGDDFRAGAFDLAAGGITITPDRAAFSSVTLADGKRPIARCADRERFTSVAASDQPGVRVVVNPGAANEAFARASFPHAALRVHTDNATVFHEIEAGRADVMVTDGIEVDHQALLHPDLCATHVPAPFTRLDKALHADLRPGAGQRGRRLAGQRDHVRRLAARARRRPTPALTRSVPRPSAGSCRATPARTSHTRSVARSPARPA